MKHRNPRILLINPPMLIVNPGYILPGLMRRHHIKAINPGVLIIASYLYRNGIEVRIVDLSTLNSFNDTDRELEKELTGFKPDIVGVSSTSAFDYLESLHIIKKTKEYDRAIISVIGGQQAGPLGEIVLIDSKDVDIVATSEGEWVTLEICRRFSRNLSYAGIPGTIVRTENEQICRLPEEAPKLPLDEIGMINLSLYPNFREFMPYIEQSRGCGGVCNYCLNRQMGHKKSRKKSRKLLEEEMGSIYDCYGKMKFMFALAANFGYTAEEAREFADVVGKYPVDWSTEFRVDLPWEEYIEYCHERGLVLCQIGLESTIPSVLKRMRKTPDPEYYLIKFRNIIKKAESIPSLKLTVGMMAYIGMNSTDLLSEFNFLSRYAHIYNMVSYMSVYVPEASDLMRQTKLFSERYGCSLVKSDYTTKTHLYPVNISSEINYEESIHWCDIMTKYFNHHMRIEKLNRDNDLVGVHK